MRGSCRKVWHLPSCVAKPAAEGAQDELSGAVDAAASPTGSRVQAAEQLYYPLLGVTEAAKLQRDVGLPEEGTARATTIISWVR